MKTIGSILLDVDLVTPEEIQRALELQKHTGQRLGEVLVSQSIVSDDDIRWALAEQLNLPYVNIRKDQIDVDVAKMLPEKFARRYHVIPILKIEDELTVVVDDPLNTTILNDIETITNSRIKVSLGRTSDIMLAIDEIYGTRQDADESQQETPPRFTSPWFTPRDIQEILDDPSGHALMRHVLINALKHEVSQIYFQPGFESCLISYRIHGGMQEQIQLGREWYFIALFRLKIMAGFAIEQLPRPQYKEFSYWEQSWPEEEEAVGRQPMKIAVSILPTSAGESVVLQVINKPLDSLEAPRPAATQGDLQQADLQALEALKARLPYLQHGAVLLAGSPYRQRIRTLYVLLDTIDHRRKNIVTLEPYTEYETDKYSQIRYTSEHLYDPISPPPPALGGNDRPAALNQKFPNTGDSTATESKRPDVPFFRLQDIANPVQARLAAWLDLVWRHAPDVLAVDTIGTEVGLAQCLDLAAHHLLLGAFDLYHVFEILAYCRDCRIPPSVLTSRVTALMAQQSVHLLCPQCKQPDTSEFTRQLGKQLQAEAGAEAAAPPTLYAPVGCPSCSMTGYREQIGLFEVLDMETWLRDLLGASASLSEIRQAAEDHGFVSIRRKSIKMLLAGETSVEQILAIIR
jgi:type IV pilus assembly protein PilB